MKHEHSHHFFGSTTIGEKGQVVVPAEARRLMGLKTGDKLLVFGMGKNMLTLAKSEQLEKMAEHLSAKLKGLREIMRKGQ